MAVLFYKKLLLFICTQNPPSFYPRNHSSFLLFASLTVASYWGCLRRTNKSKNSSSWVYPSGASPKWTFCFHATLLARFAYVKFWARRSSRQKSRPCFAYAIAFSSKKISSVTSGFPPGFSNLPHISRDLPTLTYSSFVIRGAGSFSRCLRAFDVNAAFGTGSSTSSLGVGRLNPGGIPPRAGPQ